MRKLGSSSEKIAMRPGVDFIVDTSDPFGCPATRNNVCDAGMTMLDTNTKMNESYDEKRSERKINLTLLRRYKR